jgi:putative selenate reductase
VDVYESKSFPGGMAADGIPLFRLDEECLKRDIDGILSLGVRLHTNERIDAEKFVRLRESCDYLYIAVGAQEGVKLGIPGEEAAGVLDQLRFLQGVRRGIYPELGKKVVIVGGGNSAVDAARTAKRLVGPDGEVCILYRRTRKEMPAETEEIDAALEEGIRLIELAAPECLLVEDGKVTANVCFRMELGEEDGSGRRRPIKIDGSAFHVEADSVIIAVGQEVNADFFPGGKIGGDPQTLETGLPGVFAGGDAVRGAASLIHAIADGKRAAGMIRERAFGGSGGLVSDPLKDSADFKVDALDLQVRQARRIFSPRTPEVISNRSLLFEPDRHTLDEKTARKEAARCLRCDRMCNICVTVCPNRANMAFRTEPKAYMHQAVKHSDGKADIQDLGTVRITQPFQIINIGDFCNACGNCSTFCPTSGAPYRVKPRFYLTSKGFNEAEQGYRLLKEALLFKRGQNREKLTQGDNGWVYEGMNLTVHLNPETCGVEKVDIHSQEAARVDLRHAVEMCILYESLRDPFLE